MMSLTKYFYGDILIEGTTLVYTSDMDSQYDIKLKRVMVFFVLIFHL
jgi:hypothetical protein